MALSHQAGLHLCKLHWLLQTGGEDQSLSQDGQSGKNPGMIIMLGKLQAGSYSSALSTEYLFKWSGTT